jgi:lipid-A-disaccharide synthase
MKQAIEKDILILSNGPGEITTWVRPVVKAIAQELEGKEKVRISVVLSPCPNATGKEAEIALSYPEIDRVQSPEHFFPFLLWGKTVDNWQWSKKGVVLFLGGDQFFSLLIGKKLGYRTIVYAEWDARWYRWIDRFGAMKPQIIAKVPQKYRNKFSVVGDLMADISASRGKVSSPLLRSEDNNSERELIGLLPGSKPAKLAQGVPLSVAIAEKIRALRPQTRFIIPVAPTLDLHTIGKFANPQKNPIAAKVGGIIADLTIPDSESKELPFLKTESGTRIELSTKFPAYDLLSQCRLCLTTVGANTAELGSLAVPMVVLLPTQQLDAMRSWDGIAGILANLPILGSLSAKLINWLVIRQNRLFAWPNIWAAKQIVPELIGRLQASDIAEFVIDLLSHPEKLAKIHSDLCNVRGEPGAAKRLAIIVCQELLS